MKSFHHHLSLLHLLHPTITTLLSMTMIFSLFWLITPLDKFLNQFIILIFTNNSLSKLASYSSGPHFNSANIVMLSTPSPTASSLLHIFEPVCILLVSSLDWIYFSSLGFCEITLYWLPLYLSEILFKFCLWIFFSPFRVLVSVLFFSLYIAMSLWNLLPLLRNNIHLYADLEVYWPRLIYIHLFHEHAIDCTIAPLIKPVQNWSLAFSWLRNQVLIEKRRFWRKSALEAFSTQLPWEGCLLGILVRTCFLIHPVHIRLDACRCKESLLHGSYI